MAWAAGTMSSFACEGDGGLKYRTLGRTGLLVSEIGMGCEGFVGKSRQTVREFIDRMEAAGINCIDLYSPDPDFRSNLGAALQGRREKFVLQAHLCTIWKDGQYKRTREIEEVREGFQDQLQRLGTDHVEIGMIHYVDSLADWEAVCSGPVMAYARELKERGIIGAIGLSSHNPEAALAAVHTGLVDVLMFSINPAFDMLPASEDSDTLFAEEFSAELKGIDPEHAALYSICEQHDVGITVMKPFAGGRLFDAKRSPFGVSLTPVQCIHYALTRPAVSSVLCGYDTKEQVDQAVAYENASHEEKDFASVIANEPLHAYRGQCTYCGHCKPCPAGLDIGMINKFYDLATMQPEVPATVRSHYEALEHTASACIGCRSCESRCPFGVPIAERMEKAAALFGC